MRRLGAVLGLALIVPLVAALAEPTAEVATSDASCDGVLCAGAATVDATWNTGAGQGQLGGAGNALTEDKFDPYHHQTKMVPTDGVQSKTYAKAVVLRGADGTKVAYVKTDLYLQQDLMFRRVAQLVTGGDPLNSDYAVEGLDAEGIMLGGTHNHSAPHTTSTAWGVWIFADALDLRAFDQTAKRIAEGIKAADAALRPARVGAAVIDYDEIQQNILGPATADDGTPAGFPRDHFDSELAVIRIDEVPSGEPIAAIVNLGLHPESIGGNANLISSDFTGVLEREVERTLGKVPGSLDGPVVAFSQGGLGDVEPDSSRANHPNERREFWRRDFAQAERMTLMLADAVLRAWTYVADPPSGATDFVADKHVPFRIDAPIRAIAYRFPGPLAHPLPTVSNCRTIHPGVPVAGFPDCLREIESIPGGAELIEGWRQLHDTIEGLGVPLPDNYGAPSYAAVQEPLTIHLQTIQIGEILLATCPCEPVTDMTLNFKTRADAEVDNMHLGYEWACDTSAEPIRCERGQNAWQAPSIVEVDRAAYERMRAQVRNDAAGWETDLLNLGGEHEPENPAEIKGNFTHAELGEESGFTLPLMVGTANDYVGYVVTYREYQRGDHYRKALTPFGPRTADYINTRLVEMAGELRGGPSPSGALDLVVGTLDELIQTGKVVVFGGGADVLTSVYDIVIPDDGGEPGRVLSQPQDVVERFGAATFTWEGGSNYTDSPTVVVEQLVERPRREPDWEPVASQAGGEVVVTFDWASWFGDALPSWLIGSQAHAWTATFEAFDRTDPGLYRFVVAGEHRSGRSANPYTVVSEPFSVDVWRGLTVTDLRVDGGTVSFRVAGVEAQHATGQIPGPVSIPATDVRYPFTYADGPSFIGHSISQIDGYRYCWRCTFRPWASHGAVVEAAITVYDAADRTTIYPAEWDAAQARFVVDGVDLRRQRTVAVEPGQVRDELGNTNGARAAVQP